MEVTSKRKTKSDKDKDKVKWKQEMAEDGVIDSDLDDGAVDDTAELLKLTGKPHMDDLLLSAIPVCAPYQTLSQYTYRVKLTPGNLKRGKASKQCLEIFLKSTLHASGGVDRQLDLIKRISDSACVQAICADVKIATSGSTKVTKKIKAERKKTNNAV